MRKELSCFLIDNDPDDQEIFGMALRDVDDKISCIVAENGVSALKQLKADQSYIPSLIFIDMNMPLMDGKQCLKEIKKLEWMSEVPIYLYSTSCDPHAIDEVKCLGATDFLVKPSAYQQLVQLLSTLLTQKSLTNELQKKDH